jgi:hypothetical protein
MRKQADRERRDVDHVAAGADTQEADQLLPVVRFADAVEEPQMGAADGIPHSQPKRELERGHLIGRHFGQSICVTFSGA